VVLAQAVNSSISVGSSLRSPTPTTKITGNNVSSQRALHTTRVSRRKSSRHAYNRTPEGDVATVQHASTSKHSIPASINASDAAVMPAPTTPTHTRRQSNNGKRNTGAVAQARSRAAHRHQLVKLVHVHQLYTLETCRHPRKPSVRGASQHSAVSRWNPVYRPGRTTMSRRTAQTSRYMLTLHVH
jgi:hypothetical protein